MPGDELQRRRRVVGAAIRQLRDAAGETQLETAARVCLDQGFYRGLEAGRRDASLDMLFRIADHFAVRPAVLLENVEASRGMDRRYRYTPSRF